MDKFTEVDFYKSMLNLQAKATEIAKNQVPVERDGKISYPVGDGGMSDTLNDISALERALQILKQDNA